MSAPGSTAPASSRRKPLSAIASLPSNRSSRTWGAVAIQKLRPAQLSEWHGTLAKSGGKNGRVLSGRTVGHAHRVLHRALARALRLEIVTRNVAAAVRPPRVTAAEIEILTSEQKATTLAKLEGHDLLPIAALALASGMRRGEPLALRWGDIDLAGAALRIERSLEQTKAGLRFKSPKTRNGRRSISLPASAVDALREHRRSEERRVGKECRL